MICFPTAKINLGLHILNKRSNGFHNIETVMFPIQWNDALEVIESNNTSNDFELQVSGISIDGALQDNLLYKTFLKIKALKSIPNITVYLHKNIPMGAGLGGGSANVGFFINLLNTKFKLQLSNTEKETIAASIGSDCAFFIYNKPTLCTGKGNLLTPINIDLTGYYIYVVYPNIHSNTALAYKNCTINSSAASLQHILDQPMNTWKHSLINDFEPGIFKAYPIIEQIKNTMYDNGALYASLSGSGSSVYGIYETNPNIEDLKQYPHHCFKV